MSNEDPILDEEQTFAEEEEAWGSRKESNVGAGTFLGSVHFGCRARWRLGVHAVRRLAAV